ncbi:ABC-F family ATP-binding cassette domain-containing protein [soil metagenome]|jgi:macrolide transport system ATP-binding/permease protein
MHLSVSHVSKIYEPVTVLDDLSFVISGSERVGLVGANGSGKSTLLRIISGEVEPDSGVVAASGGVEVGYLPQDPPEPGDATIEDLIYQAAGELRELERRLRHLETDMTTARGAAFDRVMDEYSERLEQFERRGGYDIDHRIDVVCAGLHITHIPRDRQFKTLSGGEKARVLLATLLLTSPDILLLDEPTNHLDFPSITWLEQYLAAYSGIMLVVSHDRRFLNQTVTRIIEIDEHSHRLLEYPGNYDHYAQAKARERAQWEIDFAEQQDEITELRKAIRQARAGVDRKAPAPRDPDKSIQEAHKARADKTASKSIRSLEERLRRIEAAPIPKPPLMMKINPVLDANDLKSNEIVRFESVSKAFDDDVVLNDLSFTLRSGQRVVLVGPNGAGKSTLLNLIAGRITPDSGRIVIAQAARVGYLDQDGVSLDTERTVFDVYRDGLDGLEHELISDLFRHGLFLYDDLSKSVGQLSSGQRRKLQIARLVAERANFLLLDEPTNHLSLDVLEEFEHALREFPGPILATSHDRWFIERFGGTVWEVTEGRVIEHQDTSERVLAGMLDRLRGA